MYLDRPLSSHTPSPRPLSPQPYTDPFADDTASPTSPDSPDSPDSPEPESRDIARLRRTHTTQGYRDGITQGKAAHLQDGFDEGYALGGRFGLKVGWLTGVVDGLAHLAREDGDRARLARMRRDAAAELALEKIFASEFFDGGGVWTYGIGDDEGGVTLDCVVERHPLVEAWMERVKAEAVRWGLGVEELGHGGEAEGGDGKSG